MSEIPIAILAGYGSVGLGVEAMVGAVILAMVFGFSFSSNPKYLTGLVLTAAMHI